MAEANECLWFLMLNLLEKGRPSARFPRRRLYAKNVGGGRPQKISCSTGWGSIFYWLAAGLAAAAFSVSPFFVAITLYDPRLSMRNASCLSGGDGDKDPGLSRSRRLSQCRGHDSRCLRWTNAEFGCFGSYAASALHAANLSLCGYGE